MTVHIAFEKKCIIPGPSGQLEASIMVEHNKPRQIWGIVCHPHSLYGGTMYNKVVTTLVKTFQGAGANTVRFNFRGVGKSAGSFDHGVGEYEDLIAVIQWLTKQHAPKAFWLAGFSFGSYVAALGAAHIPLVEKLIMVAPPVPRFPFNELPPILCQWLLVQGEKDEIVSADEVLAWAKTRHPAPTLIYFKDAGHFFHGMLLELRERIERYIAR